MNERARRREVAVAGARYLRTPVPLHFPSEETVPESKRHLMLRTALFQSIVLALQGTYAVGSDQFVYWNARDPGLRLAPDVFVCTSRRDDDFDSWKTWERGAPDLAVEIVSASDASAAEWERKLDRYLEVGVLELVRFDGDGRAGERLRVWDRVDGDLVERAVEGDQTRCETLGWYWVVLEGSESGAVLRLARDEAGQELLPTPEEERVRQERRAGEEASLREKAEQRVAELEARLRALGDTEGSSGQRG